MSYLYTGPPIVPPKPKPTGLFAAFGLSGLADVCTVDPVSNARVCTSDDTIAPAAPPAPVFYPPVFMPPVPMPMPPTTCLTCGVRPSPPIRTSPRRPVASWPLRTSGFGYRAAARTSRAPGAGRYMLAGLGDDCQVYANGARVCNAAPETVTTPVSNLRRPAWGVPPRRVFMMPPATDIDGAVPALPPSGYAPWAGTSISPAYSTSTVAPVDSSQIVAAPVPIDPTATTASSVDFSTIPTWLWIVGAGLAYMMFFKR